MVTACETVGACAVGAVTGTGDAGVELTAGFVDGAVAGGGGVVTVGWVGRNTGVGLKLTFCHSLDAE